MINLFSVPDKEKNYESYMVYALTIIWSVVTGTIVSIGFYYFPEIWKRWLTFISVSIFIAAFNLTLNRWGYTRIASWSLSIMVWLYITIPCYSGGGIHAPGILSQMSVILTAGFLLGWRGGLLIGLLTISTDFGFAYLEITGHLPKPSVTHTPITRWIGAIIPFGTILALQYYATNHLRAGLAALQYEIQKRKDAENIKDQTLHNLAERVKELKTLYAVSSILQDKDASTEKLFNEIVKIIPLGWQYPDVTAVRLLVDAKEYTTCNYKPSTYSLLAQMNTSKGTKITIEVVYVQQVPESESPFLTEERSLINMLAEMIKVDLEQRERRKELKDYKYALDIASIVSISAVNTTFTFVNENFCTASKYSAEELLGKEYHIISSGIHSPEYFTDMQLAMQDGKPYKGEFCNMAKDGTLYWVDTTIVPFLDENGKIYQYLSINHDITERKEAENKIKDSERLIKKITSQVPGNTYMFNIEESGLTNILFMNRGTDTFNHDYDMEYLTNQPEKLREILHKDDMVKFNDTMKKAYQTGVPISFQYRIVVNDKIRWRWMQAVPEKEKDGKIVWYGATSDITPLVDYIASIEQIIFDISHVIRRPISNMLGMTKIVIEEDINVTEMKEIGKTLRNISEEMDKFIVELNFAYHQKKQKAQYNFDISSSIDKRTSLFI